MAQVVGMATIYHEHAGISLVICFHVTMHVLPLNRDNKQQKTLPLCSNKSSCVHCVRLCCSSSSSRRFGILTVNWLSDETRYSNLVRLPMSLGMEPENWLLLRYNITKLASIPIFEGMEPENLFPLSWSNRRLFIVMIGSGMELWNRLPERSRSSKEVKFEMAAGSSPVNLLSRAMKYCNLVDRFPT